MKTSDLFAHLDFATVDDTAKTISCKAVTLFFNAVAMEIARNGVSYVPGIGIFRGRFSPSHEARNPQNGALIYTRDKVYIRFQPCDKLENTMLNEWDKIRSRERAL